MQTVRQRIETILESRPAASPTAIRDALSDHGISLTPDEVIDEIKELKHSVDGLMGASAECNECGFNNFEILNIPSSCPECNSTWIEEPEFTIA